MMDRLALLKQISQKLSPVYFLSGEESFFCEEIVNEIKNKFLQDFPDAQTSISIFYGKEVENQELLERAKIISLFAPMQLIIVKQAENLKKIEDFEDYFQKPNKNTILVFVYDGKLNKNTKIAKNLQKNSIFFEATKIPDWKLMDWLKEEVKKYQFIFSPEALQNMIENVGNDLEKISKNLEKLKSILPQGVAITPTLIDLHVGISRNYSVFEFQKALATKNLPQLSKILSLMAQDEKNFPFPLVLTNIYNFFSKLVLYHYAKQQSEAILLQTMKIAPFQLKEYRSAAGFFNASQAVKVIALLREYDLKSKGIGSAEVDWAVLLKDLCMRLVSI